MGGGGQRGRGGRKGGQHDCRKKGKRRLGDWGGGVENDERGG